MNDWLQLAGQITTTLQIVMNGSAYEYWEHQQVQVTVCIRMVTMVKPTKASPKTDRAGRWYSELVAAEWLGQTKSQPWVYLWVQSWVQLCTMPSILWGQITPIP